VSVHPSLKVNKVGAKHRNVLKRYERLEKLEEEERWESGGSVYGLPKVKSQKMKVKKEAKTEDEEGKPAEGEAAAPSAGTAPSTGTTPSSGTAPSGGKK